MENLILKTLKERRSIRRYSEKQVDEETLSAILEAGTYAASGMGRQAPIMVVIQDPETREKLRQMNAAIMGDPQKDPFYGAPTIVIVLADRSISTCVEDGSLVMGNLMNAAFSLGVDSCWIHRAKQNLSLRKENSFFENGELRETISVLDIVFSDIETVKCLKQNLERAIIYIAYEEPELIQIVIRKFSH